MAGRDLYNELFGDKPSQEGRDLSAELYVNEPPQEGRDLYAELFGDKPHEKQKRTAATIARDLDKIPPSQWTLLDRIRDRTLLYPKEEHEFRRFAKGASSGPVMGIVQKGAKIAGNDKLAQQIEENAKEGSLLGKMLQPEALLTGRAAANFILKGAGLLNQSLRGGTVAAPYAALSVNESPSGSDLVDIAQSGGTAFLAGSALPPFMRGTISAMQWLKDNAQNAVSQITQKGRAALGHRMAVDQLSEADRQAALDILKAMPKNAKTPIGAAPTVADVFAAQNVGQTTKSPIGARVAATEVVVAKKPGGEQLVQQRAGREQEIRNAGARMASAHREVRDPETMRSAADVAQNEAAALRKSLTDPLYGRVNVQWSTADDTLEEILNRDAVKRATALDTKSASNVPRPVMTPAEPERASMFIETREPAKPATYSLEHLHDIYKQLEKQANALSKASANDPTGMAMKLAYEMRQAKNALGNWMRKKSPDFAEANKIHSGMKKSETRMEVGEELRKKLISPTGEITPDKFIATTTDMPTQEHLIRSVTGRPDQSISKVFGPKRTKDIETLRNEAIHLTEKDSLAKLVNADLSDEKVFQLPMFLRWDAALANKMLRDEAQTGAADVVRATASALSSPDLFKKLLLQEMLRDAQKKSAAAAWNYNIGKTVVPISNIIASENQ